MEAHLGHWHAPVSGHDAKYHAADWHVEWPDERKPAYGAARRRSWASALQWPCCMWRRVPRRRSSSQGFPKAFGLALLRRRCMRAGLTIDSPPPRVRQRRCIRRWTGHQGDHLDLGLKLDKPDSAMTQKQRSGWAHMAFCSHRYID